MNKTFAAFRDLAFVTIGTIGTIYYLFLSDSVNRAWLLFFIILLALPTFFHDDHVTIASKAVRKYVIEMKLRLTREASERERAELLRKLQRIEKILEDKDK